MVTVNNCCFCASLELGCKIIGFIEAISNLLCLIGAVFGLVQLTVHEGQIESKGTVLGALVLFIIVFGIGFLASYCLLDGVYKKKPSMIKIWLYINVILLVLLVISFCISIIKPSAQASSGVINILLLAYFLLVVHSYHKSLNALDVNAS